jgi:hypothetical protein
MPGSSSARVEIQGPDLQSAPAIEHRPGVDIGVGADGQAALRVNAYASLDDRALAYRGLDEPAHDEPAEGVARQGEQGVARREIDVVSARPKSCLKG